MISFGRGYVVAYSDTAYLMGPVLALKKSSADGICVKDNINLLYLAEDW